MTWSGSIHTCGCGFRFMAIYGIKLCPKCGTLVRVIDKQE